MFCFNLNSRLNAKWFYKVCVSVYLLLIFSNDDSTNNKNSKKWYNESTKHEFIAIVCGHNFSRIFINIFNKQNRMLSLRSNEKSGNEILICFWYIKPKKKSILSKNIKHKIIKIQSLIECQTKDSEKEIKVI